MVLLPAAGFIALAWRQHSFVARYAVNMMYWDQWDFYTPLFKHGDWWAVVDQQHGPHRQGVGFLVTRLLAQLGHWNSRWDAFGVSFVLMAAALLGVRVAGRGGFRPGLVLIPVALIFFNLRQYENFTGASNLSHGAVPMLLFMACGLCWYIRRPGLRLLLLAGLSVMLTFTGFGLFAALINPLLILLECFQADRAGDRVRARFAAAALLLIAAGWCLFIQGYVFAPAVDDYHFPYEHPLEYFGFVGLMLANFFGIGGWRDVRMAAGLIIGVSLLVICLRHGCRLVKFRVEQKRPSVVIFSFSAFVLVYCANTAVGRITLGLGAANASRYVTLMIPGAMALLLHCKYFPPPRGRQILFLATLLFAAGTLRLTEKDWQSVNWFHDGRAGWKAAYLATHDELQANKISGFPVYPKPGAITQRLQFLEQNHLNLFAPDNP